MSRMTPRRDMRLFLVAIAMTCLWGAQAFAAQALLAVSINGKDSGLVLPVKADAGRLLVTQEDFRKLHLALPARAGDDGRYDLAHVPGLGAHVDEAGQRLVLTVAAAALPRQLYDLGAGSAAPAPLSDSGAILHYDVSATADDVRRFGSGLNGGATLGLDVFTPEARITSNGFADGSAGGWRGARLDSAMIFDRPEKLTHLILGDAISATPDWGRAVRFGGVEWASDFGLRPGLVTQPLPAFFGQSEVPATVDVFSGAAKLYQQDVDPGPFELRNLPIVTGGGSATVVTRDVLGRETTQTLALYTDAGLLAPGLESWALDAGFLRRGYGENSFGYDTPLLSTNWRHGFTDTLTVEAHGEAAPGLALLGGGAEWGFGFGSLTADIAGSGGDRNGNMASFSAHALAGPLNLYGQGWFASSGWRDLASLTAGGVAPPRQRWQGGVTADLDWAGTLGVSWISSKYTAKPSVELLSSSWTVQLPDGAFAALTGLRDFQSGALSGQVSFNIPLGHRGLLGVSAGNDSALALYDNPADPDGGFGYRLASGWQDGGRFQGEADWIGPRVALDGGVSVDQGAPSLRADASGALVWLRGSLFATHDPGGAVALVEAGEKDIHIYRENRPVAVSDADGEALLTGLDPWSPNRIAVESRDYAFDTLVEKTDAVVVPRASSGVVVDFAPKSRHPLLATITGGNGPPPAGARVQLDGEQGSHPLGRDGQFFIADLDHPRGAVIESGGIRCRVYIEPHQMGAHSQPLLCLREASGAY
jgi:outer membrane usher protein